MSASDDVLASVLLLGSVVWRDVRNVLRPEHFARKDDQSIWRACQAVAERGDFDEVTIRDHMGKAVPCDRISELTCLVPSSVLVAGHARRVREQAIARELAAELGHLRAELLDSPTEALDSAPTRIQQICNGRLTGAAGVHISEVIGEAFTTMQERAKSGERPGIPSGLTSLDAPEGPFKGFRPGKLIVVAGRPGMGKTALALQLAREVGRTGNVFFASLEMDRAELGTRLMSSESRVDFGQLMDARIPREHAKALVDACGALAEANIWVEDEPRMSVHDIRLAARKRGPLSLVVVDYLQLIQPADRRQPRELQVSEMSRDLKLLSKEMGCSVLLLAQLNREVEKRAGKPRLSDLRESGSIEQDADTVMFVHREDPMQSDAEVIVAKQRAGSLGIANLHWRGNVQRFESTTHREVAE